MMTSHVQFGSFKKWLRPLALPALLLTASPALASPVADSYTQSAPAEQDKSRQQIEAAWKEMSKAIESNNLDKIRTLLKGEVTLQDLENAGNDPLSWAINRNQIETVRALIEAGANLNRRNNSESPAVLSAVSVENLEMVKLLVNAGGRIDLGNGHSGVTPLMLASGKGDVKMAQYLLETALFQGLDMDAFFNQRMVEEHQATTALMEAAESQQIDMLEWLYWNGADLEARDASGQTALFYVVKGYKLTTPDKKLQTIAAILEIQPKLLDGQDDKGQTALFLAAQSHDKEALKLLLAKGADPSVRDKAGNTALMKAAETHRYEAIALLAPKSDVNVRNNKGETALIRAAQFKNMAEVIALMAAGADASIKDNKGRTAIDYAMMPYFRDND